MATRESARFDLAMTALIAAAVVLVGIVLSRRHSDSTADADLDYASADQGDRV
jgi:GABA permease